MCVLFVEVSCQFKRSILLHNDPRPDIIYLSSANPLACFLQIDLAGNCCLLTEYRATYEKSSNSLLHPFCSCLRPRSRISPSRHTSDGNSLLTTLRNPMSASGLWLQNGLTRKQKWTICPRFWMQLRTRPLLPALYRTIGVVKVSLGHQYQRQRHNGLHKR